MSALRALSSAAAPGAEEGVPDGCVGRLPRTKEFESVGEFSAAVVSALESQSRQLQEQDHELGSIPVVSYRETSASRFWDSFARRGRPVVLKGAGQAMGYDLDVWGARSLASRFPDYPVTVRTANGVDYNALESVDTTLTQYLNGGSGDKISSFRRE